MIKSLNDCNLKINKIINYSLKYFFKNILLKREIEKMIGLIVTYHIRQIDEYISKNNIDISSLFNLDNIKLLDIFNFNKLYNYLSYEISSENLQEYDNNFAYYNLINKAVCYKMISNNINIEYIKLFQKTFCI